VADGVTVDTFMGTGGAPNALVTITTTLGTVASADVSPSYAGIQVLSDMHGNFTFQIRRPTAGGTAIIGAEEVTGAHRGTLDQTSPLAAPRRFDFNGPSNLTAAGFIGVRGADLYSPLRGFGWQTAVGEFERSATGISASPPALYLDGNYGYISSGARV